MKYSYARNYIFCVLIGHFWSMLGIPSIYFFSVAPLLIIVCFHYLIVKVFVIDKLEKDEQYTKRDILPSYLGITTVFNALFFLLYLQNVFYFLLVSGLNIFYIFLFHPKEEKSEIRTKKNIDEYFKNHPQEK